MEKQKKQDVKNNSDISKYFCNYNQSLALKELGFDMPCFAYVYTGDTGNNVDRYEETEPSRAINFNHDSLCISQPLKSQVFEWFRDKHNLHHEIEFNEDEYLAYVNGLTANIFKTYEEAESACIDKLIEIVKNK